MRNLVKLVCLDLSSFYGSRRLYFWSTLTSIVIYLIIFLNGNLALPFAGGIIGASVGILMMPFVITDRHGLEKVYTMLPVRRQTIVASHYLFGLIMMVLIDLSNILTIGIGLFARSNPVRDLQDVWWLMLIGTAFIILQITLSFPMMIGMGFQRAPLTAYLPMVLVLVIAVFLDKSLNFTLDSLRPWLGLIALALILLFALSWWLSIQLYQKREF